MNQSQEFDKRYRNFRRIDDTESEDDRAEAALVTRWDLCVQSWPSHFIKTATYGYTLADGNRDEVEEWQKFRVSMKAQSTRMKLWRLKCLYAEKCYRTEGRENWARWKCRIDNYIGALVRAGLLEEKTFKVLR